MAGIHTKSSSSPKDYQELLDRDSRQVPKTFRSKGVRDIGPIDIPTSWYLDPEIHRLELERIWKRSWQMACREEDVSQVGDTWVYKIASLSFVIVRSTPNTIRAFYNSCLHRGRPLRDCPGHTSQLKCPFHGFTWSLDGALTGVPSREQFPTVKNEEFRLPEAKVGRWGGFVFINPDPAAEPLEDFMGGFAHEFAPAPLDDKVKTLHISKIIPANWKIVQDAFLEGFHVLTTHPQWAVAYSHDLNQYDVFENYSRIIIPAGSPSKELRWTPSNREMFNCMVGAWDDIPPPVTVDANRDIRAAAAELFRNQCRPLLGDKVDDHSDAEFLDPVMYNLFPNFGPFIHPAGSLVYTLRPCADPNRTVFDVMLLTPWTGDQRPPAAKERRLRDDQDFTDVAELDFFGAILNQDTANLQHMMEGVANNQRGKLVLSRYHELKLRHFYHLYAKTMGLELPA
ncbi:MAG TPA: aromatic ring-hydroxylating dioxygenase subunit alpha [Steroidobacteraceae bacterium]|nr:aromatic ring-hydroxylating dioxygenase subunit alpha [Steroidobacteraceae bacterium]